MSKFRISCISIFSAVFLFLGMVGPPAYADINTNVDNMTIPNLDVGTVADFVKPIDSDIVAIAPAMSASGMYLDFAASNLIEDGYRLNANAAPEGGGFFGTSGETSA